MKAVNSKILVRVDMSQKNYMKIGDTVVQTAHAFGTNYRERSPVIGQFAESNRFFKKGEVAIFHHNHFYSPSPYHLQDDLFSVPLGKTIFGTLNNEGEMTPVMGNIICKLIPVQTEFPVPEDEQKTYINRYEIVNPGWTTYKAGGIIFTRPYSGYEIIYTWDAVERRIIKISDDMVCGVLKK